MIESITKIYNFIVTVPSPLLWTIPLLLIVFILLVVIYFDIVKLSLSRREGLTIEKNTSYGKSIDLMIKNSDIFWKAKKFHEEHSEEDITIVNLDHWTMTAKTSYYDYIEPGMMFQIQKKEASVIDGDAVPYSTHIGIGNVSKVNGETFKIRAKLTAKNRIKFSCKEILYKLRLSKEPFLSKEDIKLRINLDGSIEELEAEELKSFHNTLMKLDEK